MSETSNTTTPAPVVSGPVETYMVAERRPWTGNTKFIFGDDWSPEFPTREEAEETRSRWVAQNPKADPSDFGVFALVRVDEAAAR